MKTWPLGFSWFSASLFVRREFHGLSSWCSKVFRDFPERNHKAERDTDGQKIEKTNAKGVRESGWKEETRKEGSGRRGGRRRRPRDGSVSDNQEIGWEGREEGGGRKSRRLESKRRIWVGWRFFLVAPFPLLGKAMDRVWEAALVCAGECGKFRNSNHSQLFPDGFD